MPAQKPGGRCMRLSIAVRLGLGVLPSLFALVAVGALFFSRLNDIEEDGRWVGHTQEVLHQLSEFKAVLTEAESNARAYQLGSREVHRQAFQDAAAEARAQLPALRRLVIDNPEQQKRVDQLGAALTFRLQRMQNFVDRTAEGGTAGNGDGDAVVRPLAPHEDVTRAVIQSMETAETLLLSERKEQALRTQRRSAQIVWGATAGAVLVVLLLGYSTARRIVRPLGDLEAGARRVGEGNYGHRVPVHSEDEIGQVAIVFNRMVEQVRERERVVSEQAWVKSSLAGFAPVFQSRGDLEQVCTATLSHLADVLQVPHLVLYVREAAEGGERLRRRATFAAAQAPELIAPGTGLAGQAYASGRLLELQDVPDGYLRVSSALGEAAPRHVYVAPVAFEGKVCAVLEIAALQPPSEVQREFLERFVEGLGLVLKTLEARQATDAALAAQTELAHTLLEQREELQQSNEELVMQGEQLRASERLAREQQEELRLANEEQQQANNELRELTHSLDQKNQQLTQTSAFKSEFLSNMSHELRTPLNSLLILSKLLIEDSEAPLTEKQQQYARTINEAGNDLLQQINEILDLARIESGKVKVELAPLAFGELGRLAEQTFRHVADSKQLEFDIRLDPALGEELVTDRNRLWQVLKNLLSNAFKFTTHGKVSLSIAPAEAGWLAFAVADTGIGIPAEKQAQIFEAFQQADSGIARQYGGTGLGLSISLKLAQLLGGTVQLRSEPGKGSTFTLRLPLQAVPEREEGVAGPAVAPPPLAMPVRPLPSLAAPAAAGNQPVPPRGPAAEVVLIVTDSQSLTERIAATLAGRQAGWHQVATTADLVAACVQHAPLLIVFDASEDLPERWTALGHLKQDARTRHVSVHVICPHANRLRALRLGAASCTLVPLAVESALDADIARRLDRLVLPQKNVLVVEDDPKQMRGLLDLIGNGDVKASGVGTAAQALEVISTQPVDCVVLDLGLPDMDGVDLIDTLNLRLGSGCPPVIVYSARQVSREEEISLMRHARALIVKGASSPERLVDELALLLSRVPSRLSPATRQMLDRSKREDPVLAGRKVLVVDDDIRNIFAISAALETYGAVVLHAESGLDGIAALQANPDTDVVLMDVMMPTIDGLEAIRRIRDLPEFASLPIIAVTAKAMPGDRETCLSAGASDYLSKPVDLDRLRAMIRVWLSA
ncbi:MAG: response regulator [Aquabacterium sp.]|nr:MAG: response regulator [Aquabacterium sp.]